MLRKPSYLYLYHQQYPNFKQLSSNELIVNYGRLPFFNLAQQPGRPPFSVPSFNSLLFISWRSVRLIKSQTKIIIKKRFFFSLVFRMWPANFVSFKMTAFMFEFEARLVRLGYSLGSQSAYFFLKIIFKCTTFRLSLFRIVDSWL